MSRVGRKPITIPDKVKVEVKGDVVHVTGPLGNLSHNLPRGVTVSVADGTANVGAPKKATRTNRGYQGLFRALLANMVNGVTTGYHKSLDINGVGYKAELAGDTLTLSLGFSHTKSLKLPTGIKAEVNKQQNAIKIIGIDKQMVGQVAAKIRAFKVPEPYKAKGVKYADETIRRKVGKAGVK